MIAACVLVVIAILLVAAMGIRTLRYVNELASLRHQMEEYNHITCPEEAVAKVVENGKVTCILRVIGYGSAIKRMPPGWLNEHPAKRDRKEK